MKRFILPCFIVTILLLILVSSTIAQCDKDISVYGFLDEGSVDYGFGHQVAAAGDVDNDSYPDFMVAGLKLSFPQKIAVTVFSGLTGDSIRTYYEDANSVYGMSEFGDYNNDNYDDILVNGVVYSGLTGDTLMYFGGTSMRKGIGIGDADGDGIYEFLIPDNGWSSAIGRADLLSGANGDTLQSWEGLGDGGQFGYSVAAAGDFNNDGYADVVIGQPKVDISGTDRGRTYVYSGYDGLELLKRSGPAAGLQFGYNVVGGGDLDNDGYDDILVAGQSENSGSSLKVWAYSGKTDSLIFSVSGESYLDKFGYAMDGIGDVSNDGHDDFVVSAFRYASNKGNLYVFSGADGSLLYESFNRQSTREMLGYSVAGLGDTDGDGSPDFVAGAKTAEGPDDPTNDNMYRGAAHLYKCFYPSLACQKLDDFDIDFWDNRCDNCQWFYNVYQEDDDGDGIGDICEDSALTYIGTVRTVSFNKAQWEFIGIHPQVMFDNVTAEGYTYYSMTPLEESSGFEHIPWLNPLKYNLSTTAVFEDSLVVRLIYIDTTLSSAQEADLQLFQKIDGYWRNITSQAANITYNLVSGKTTRLGEFLVGNCLDTPDIDVDGVGDFCDNCPFGYNPGQEDANANGIGDVCENSQTVSSGAEASVSLNAADETVVVNFDMVSQEGTVDLLISGNGPASGSNFTLYPANPPRYYEISTDALFSGEISITLNYDDAGMTAEEEGLLTLWHYEGENWVDITFERNTVDNYLTGLTTFLSPFTVGLIDSPTDISEEILGKLPLNFNLRQNYPNPFNPATNISFNLPRKSFVSLSIYNLLGQKIETVISQEMEAGYHNLNWNGANVASGLYFYRIKTESFSETKKMLLLK